MIGTPDTRLSELAELLLGQSPDGMIFADRNGIIRYWNEAAARIFGFPAMEAEGQHLDLIVPERFRAAHWRGFDQALATGNTKYHGKALPTRALHREGHQFYVELSFSIVRGTDGAIIGALANARDITERFSADRAKGERLKELERQLADLQPPQADGGA